MSDADPGAHVDLGLFHRLMDEFSRFGATSNGGITRLAGSPEDGHARDHLVSSLLDAEFEVRVDAVGNIYGIAEFAGPGQPLVMTGSHLDSQALAGRYDGTYGVIAAYVAALAVKRRVARGDFRPQCNLAVVNWTNEEGARFRPSLLGSGVYVGALDRDDALRREDDRSVTVAEALAGIGYLRNDEAPPHPAFYAELHVEQGKTLERAGSRIGVVTRCWAAYKYEITFHGVQAHTGPTLMEDRRDALYAAARVITHVHDLASTTEGTLHSSVGRIEVHPNSSNVVPAEVTIAAELRAPSEQVLQAADRSLREAVVAAEGAAGVTARYRSATRRPASAFDGMACRLAERAAESAGFRPMRVETVAGHDAISLMSVAPAALIFVPSVDGISHNEAELTHRDDLEAGVLVLEQLLAGLCREGAPGPQEPAMGEGMRG